MFVVQTEVAFRSNARVRNTLLAAHFEILYIGMYVCFFITGQHSKERYLAVFATLPHYVSGDLVCSKLT